MLLEGEKKLNTKSTFGREKTKNFNFFFFKTFLKSKMFQ